MKTTEKSYRIVHTYNLGGVWPDTIVSSDLEQAAETLRATQDPDGLNIDGLNMEAGKIEVLYGDKPQAETADYLWLPEVRRLGIAWGADADWGDATDLDEGIDCWLNRQEEWEARN